MTNKEIHVKIDSMTNKEIHVKIDSMISRLGMRISQLDEHIREYKELGEINMVASNTIKRDTFQLVLNDVVSNFKL